MGGESGGFPTYFLLFFSRRRAGSLDYPLSITGSVGASFLTILRMIRIRISVVPLALKLARPAKGSKKGAVIQVPITVGSLLNISGSCITVSLSGIICDELGRPRFFILPCHLKKPGRSISVLPEA
jgi:hypothetical protein